MKVRDNGLGVPEEKRTRLFERFFRAHEDTKTNIEGTGLGLSIVRDTAASLGAWAEFTEGASVFAFSMPARRLARDSIDSPSESAGRIAEGSAR